MQSNSQSASAEAEVAPSSSEDDIDLDLTASDSDQSVKAANPSEDSANSNPPVVLQLDPKTIEQKEPNRLSQAFDSPEFQDLIDSVLNARGNPVHREPWNKGKLVGQKAPFKLKDIWALRVRLQMEGRVPLAASTPASSALRRFMRSWPFSSLQPSGWLCIALIWWPPTIRSLIASTCSCWPSRHLPLQTPGLTLAYFIDLQPDTLTSCCGSTFRPDRPGLAAEISAIEPRAALCTLAIALASVLAFGAVAKRSRWMAGGYAVVSAAFFGVALAAVGAGISPYVYESPHHHCPFCLLEREYGYIGYALYAPLFVGESAGLSSGVLSLRPPPSLAAWLPARAGQLRRISMAGFVAFSVLAALAVMMSAIRL